MNKQDLVDELALETGNTKRDVERIVNAFMTAVTETIAQGEKVTLVGFGTFEVRQRKARQGRNPKTMAVINIPAKRVAALKVGMEFAEAVAKTNAQGDSFS